MNDSERMGSVTTQRCSSCKIVKDVSAFHRNRFKPSGYSQECRDCRSAARKRRALEVWQEAHPGYTYRKRARPVHDGMKWCPECQSEQPLSMFTPRGPYCRPCQKKVGYRRRYGLEVEVVMTLMEQQDGLCAICRRRKAMHVDHNHETSVVRGLLCNRCNLGLGAYNDDARLLRAAAAYLEKGNESELTSARCIELYAKLTHVVTAAPVSQEEGADAD